MEELIFKIKGEGDTIGGVVTCVVKGCPIGLGQPVFGKLHAALGAAMLSINAAKAFEYGDGFKGLSRKARSRMMCSTTITDVSRPAPIIRAVYKVESVTGKTSISV